MFQLCESLTEKDIKNCEGCIAERKLDGTRAITKIKNGKVTILGRRGNTYNKQVPNIVNALKDYPNCILDGEIVSSDFNFTSLQSIIHTQNALKIKLLNEKYSPIYFVFDILELGERDLRNLPLETRKKLLKETIRHNDNVKMLDYTKDIEGLWKEIKKEGGEGIIIKDYNSSYNGKRDRTWCKVKAFKEGELKVNQYEINNGGILVTDGKHRVQVAGEQSKMVKDIIDEKGQVAIRIQYLEKTKDDMFRFISFRGLK